MRHLMIWKCVGFVSAMSGLVCFGLSSTYKKSFGKLRIGGLMAYLFLGLIMSCLILWGKRIRVPEKFQGLVAALISVVICSISVLLDKLVTGQSDALSIISYASFALMSLSTSRKSDLGFETGFSSFFLSLFAQQLGKINLKLFPIAVIFCSFVIILRHYSESTGVQFGSITPNGYQRPIEVGPPNAVLIDINDEGQVSGQSLLSTNDQQNNQEEPSQATHHSPSIREVSEESMLDSDSEQNMEQDEDPSSLPAESWEQAHVSLANNVLTTPNSWMPSSGEPESISRAPTRGLRRRRLPAVKRKARALRRLIPGCRKVSFPGLMEETNDYISALEMQVMAMTALTELMGGGETADRLGLPRP